MLTKKINKTTELFFFLLYISISFIIGKPNKTHTKMKKENNLYKYCLNKEFLKSNPILKRNNNRKRLTLLTRDDCPTNWLSYDFKCLNIN